MIEDNPTDVFLIKQAIAAHALAVDLQVFEDGEEAIRLIARLDANESQPCPQLMLLDINLPKTDGFEVLGALRNSKRCPHIPVIVMTSSAAPADREKSSALKANAYFRKPSRYDEFLEIGEIIRKHLKIS